MVSSCMSWKAHPPGYSFTVISLSLSLLLGLFRGTHISSLNLTFAALSLTFIRGDKPFLVFRVDREIIGLPYGQGQLSRILESTM